MNFSLRAPDFWRSPASFAGRLLAPFGWLYGTLASIHAQTTIAPFRSTVPVICVGNATVGGAGKTPVCRFLIDSLKTDGWVKNPVVVMRGYRGRLTTPTLVTPEHTVADVGDEAVMQARHVPVIIAATRAKGIRHAEKLGFDCVVTDDGLQNSGFVKDFTILVIDGPYGFGNGRVFPAGPLRMTLDDTFARVDAVCIIGGYDHTLPLGNKPLFTAQMAAATAPMPTTPVVAFAGLGRPSKFRETLDSLEQPVQMFVPFPDHHVYSDRELTDLSRRCAPLLTTEKDWVRLNDAWRAKVTFLPVNLQVHESDALLTAIKTKVRP